MIYGSSLSKIRAWGCVTENSCLGALPRRLLSEQKLSHSHEDFGKEMNPEKDFTCRKGNHPGSAEHKQVTIIHSLTFYCTLTCVPDDDVSQLK